MYLACLSFLSFWFLFCWLCLSSSFQAVVFVFVADFLFKLVYAGSLFLAILVQVFGGYVVSLGYYFWFLFFGSCFICSMPPSLSILSYASCIFFLFPGVVFLVLVVVLSCVVFLVLFVVFCLLSFVFFVVFLFVVGLVFAGSLFLAILVQVLGLLCS